MPRGDVIDQPTGRWSCDREQSIITIVLSSLAAGWIAWDAISFWSRTSDLASLIVSFVLASALFVFLVARCALAGARAEDAGLRIRNPFRTRLIPWSEIVGIRIGSHGLWPRVVVVDLRDFKSVHIWGLQGPNPLVRPRSAWKLEAEVARLEGAARRFGLPAS